MENLHPLPGLGGVWRSLMGVGIRGTLADVDPTLSIRSLLREPQVGFKGSPFKGSPYCCLRL